MYNKMLIKIDRYKCICLKNKNLYCKQQCPFKLKNGRFCNKHNKGKFKTAYDYNLIIIQAHVRRFITQCKMYRIYGPAYQNLLLSHDNLDPISLEQIWDIKNSVKINICEIPRYLIFSFKDSRNKIRVYNILSLLKIKSYDNKDPITRTILDPIITQYLEERLNFMKHFNLWDDKLVQHEKQTQIQNVKNMVTDITIILNHNNIYINNTDILNISHSKLVQLYSECRSILYHPDNVSIYNKLSKDNLFFQTKGETLIKISNITEIQTIVFNEILQILKQPELHDKNKHISYIILGALMYVSPNIYNIYTNELQFT